MGSMALYLIGDVQGCDAPLGVLLDEIAFSPSRDQLVLLGDLVNRGPTSLAVLRRMRKLDGAAQCLLGNHDLHLLAVAEGLRKPGRRDTLGEILSASDRAGLIDWLRHRSMALHRRIGGQDLLMVHAGVLPGWNVADTIARATELESALRSPDWRLFLRDLFGNLPAAWSSGLRGHDRLRVIVNALTRLRYCTNEGLMEFETKDIAANPPAGFMPWYEVPNRQTRDALVAFGHWSTLGYLSRPDLLSTDSGCVWGGCLTAVRIGATLSDRETIQVGCETSQQPG